VTRSRDEIQAELAAYTRSPGALTAEMARMAKLCNDLQAQFAHAIPPRDELREALQHVQHSNDENRKLRAEFEKIVRSKSWRLTQPLRTANSAVRRLARALTRLRDML
jgi:predicted RNase H-like nuclease (RuvC/YqgF family)